MSSSSSAAAGDAVSTAGSRGTTQLPKPKFDSTLAPGKIMFPNRPIGFVGPEEAVVYPTRWPPHIEAAMKRRGDKPIRLYADGIFDLAHYGHYRALEQAKRSLPNVYLLVGCCNDEITHKLKGQTVLTDKERYESLRAIKWVDEVVPDAPWVITDEFLEKYDIDFVAHDALPYVDTSGQSSSGDVYAHLKQIGKFHETQRTEGVSTSDLIIRIVSRYDAFVRRNLSRGFSAKEMNVGFLKEQVIKLEIALEKQREKAKKRAQMISDDAKKQVEKLSDTAESIHYKLVRVFSSEGPELVRSTLRGLRDEVVEGLNSLRKTFSSAAGSVPSTSSEAEDTAGEESAAELAEDKAAEEAAGPSASDGASTAAVGKSSKKVNGAKGRRRGNGEAHDEDKFEKKASELRAASFAIEHSSGAALNAIHASSSSSSSAASSSSPAPAVAGSKRKASAISKKAAEDEDDSDSEDEGATSKPNKPNGRGKKAASSSASTSASSPRHAKRTKK